MITAVMNLVRRFTPGEALVMLLVLLPALVALPVLLSASPSAASDWLRVAGRLSGILGLTCLLLAGILAVRVPGFDQPFGGLTRLWRLHHVLGTASLLLLMLHPLLFAFATVPAGASLPSVALFPPLSQWASWIGWGALLAMMIYLAPTYSFFGPPHYQRWKRLHLLSGAALLLGAIHGFALNTVFDDAGNRIVWGGLGLLAIGAFLWRTLISKRLSVWEYRVATLEPLAHDVMELVLEPTEEPLAHRAGQFVYLTPRDPQLSAGRNEEHPYTISSAPQAAQLRIAIKDLGDASHALQTVTPGSIVHLDGPYGRFFRHGVVEPELWLGGGIGLTPFVARARELAATGSAVDICLVYCAQDKERAYFLDELESIATGVEGLRVIPHFFMDNGPLTAKFLQQNVPDYAGRAPYLCGPLPMLRLCRQILRRAGVSAHRIRSEEFALL